MVLQERANAVSDGIHKSVETNGFYQTPNSMAIKAIRGKLTAADWALWSYLQMIDPFGDKMIRPLAKIFCGMMMGYSYFIFWLLK